MTFISPVTRRSSPASSDSSLVASRMSASLVGGSARVRLAHLALESAEKVPGVVGTDAGPGALCVTADPEYGVLRGVSVIASADGRYEINLCLNAKLVPLLELGEAVASAVGRRVKREGLGAFLGEVHVEFAQVLTEAEIVAQRERAAQLAAQQALAAQPVAPDVSTVGAHVSSAAEPALSSQPPAPPNQQAVSRSPEPAPAPAETGEPLGSGGTYTFIIVTPPSHAADRERES